MKEIKSLISAIFEAAKDFEGIQLTEEKEDILYNSSMTASVYYTEINKDPELKDFCQFWNTTLKDCQKELTNCLNDIKGLNK